MPPRKKAAAKAALPAAPPLDGCKIALCGVFPKLTQATLKQHIETLGASPLNSVTPDATHLVVTPENYKKPTAKVKAAKALDIPIVGVQWLLDCLSANAKQAEAPHSLAQPTAAAAAPTPAPAAAPAVAAPPVAAPPAAPAAKGRKRAAPAISAANGTNGTNGTNGAALPASPTAAAAPVAKRQKKDAKGTNDDAKTDAKADAKADTEASARIVVPVDECCPMANVAVHIDEDGVVWDASLNQTNSGHNNNKFYRIQVLRNSAGKYHTWTRWGRVGERGQSATLGGGTLDDAQKNFNKKFRDKSGIAWERRSDDPRPGKYAYVERSYQPDSDDDEDDADEDDAKAEFKTEEVEDTKVPECTLAPPVQSLMELIFNRQFFAATMSDLNYDANKLPLGKLSKVTITRGFQALKNLSALIDDQSLAQSEYSLPYHKAVENLSNLYYSVIPHAFGRNRPPIITDNTRLKKEIELLESLSDMKDAELLMKVDKARSSEDRSVHPADKQFQGLGMEEVTPLDHRSDEFRELSRYLNSTTGQTHHVSYNIQDIFRIERRGEKDRFEACDLASTAAKDTDTRLLWHGSRVTNFGGILGQGLRIAPPEAPVSGYMFGKGIYLADMSSKSAGYCASGISNGTGLLLLCEAKLGDPVQKLTNASYTAGEDAKAKGLFATLGQGRTAPPVWKDASAVHKDLAGVQMVSLGWAVCFLMFCILTYSPARCQLAAHGHRCAKRRPVLQRVYRLRCKPGPPALPLPRPHVGVSVGVRVCVRYARCGVYCFFSSIFPRRGVLTRVPSAKHRITVAACLLSKRVSMCTILCNFCTFSILFLLYSSVSFPFTCIFGACLRRLNVTKATICLRLPLFFQVQVKRSFIDAIAVTPVRVLPNLPISPSLYLSISPP